MFLKALEASSFIKHYETMLWILSLHCPQEKSSATSPFLCYFSSYNVYDISSSNTEILSILAFSCQVIGQGDFGFAFNNILLK